MSEKKYRVVLHQKALAEIQELPAKVKPRVKLIIDGLATEPRPRQAERLKGRSNAYRIRVGNYRLVYELHATELVVYVVGIAHRREVYLRLLRRRSHRES